MGLSQMSGTVADFGSNFKITNGSNRYEDIGSISMPTSTSVGGSVYNIYIQCLFFPYICAIIELQIGKLLCIVNGCGYVLFICFNEHDASFIVTYEIR